MKLVYKTNIINLSPELHIYILDMQSAILIVEISQ